MKSKIVLVVLIMLLLSSSFLLFVPNVHASTVSTFQPDSKANWLDQGSATTNHAALTYCRVHGKASYVDHAITTFNMSATIPSDATILSATLSFYYESYFDHDPVGRTVNVCNLTQTAWNEVQSTWNIYKTGSNWATAGGDYDGTNGVASCVVPASFGWLNWTVTNIVQYATTNKARIVDFLLKDSSETASVNYCIDMYDEDYTTDSTKQPKLVVEWRTAAQEYTAALSQSISASWGVADKWTARIAVSDSISITWNVLQQTFFRNIISQNVGITWNIATKNAYAIILPNLIFTSWNNLIKWQANLNIMQSITSTFNLLISSAFSITNTINILTALDAIIIQLRHYFMGITLSITATWDVIIKWVGELPRGTGGGFTESDLDDYFILGMVLVAIFGVGLLLVVIERRQRLPSSK
jgi:hypothetical protein